MIIHDEKDSGFLRSRKEIEARIIREGAQRWQEQLEAARKQKIANQQKTMDMLQKYWPWESLSSKPRGLRNLRLEGLFPEGDFKKAKRSVDPLDWGRPGGGAPNINSQGHRSVRIKEHDQLRFQYGGNMRKCVDDNIRYRTDKSRQSQYKADLDNLLAEKAERLLMEEKRNNEALRNSFSWPSPWGQAGPGGVQWRASNTIGLNFFSSLGWSNADTMKSLKSLQEQAKQRDERHRNIYANFKKVTLGPPNKVMFPASGPKKSSGRNALKAVRLAPLSSHGKDSAGVELVPIMASKRADVKIPLCSTDVTRVQGCLNSGRFLPQEYAQNQYLNRIASNYLNDLHGQMSCKLQQLRSSREEEIESSRQHFRTLDCYWGRPGHGAPRDVLKKGALNNLLYPVMNAAVSVA